MAESEKRRHWPWWAWLLIILFPIPIGVGPWWLSALFLGAFGFLVWVLVKHFKTDPSA